MIDLYMCRDEDWEISAGGDYYWKMVGKGSGIRASDGRFVRCSRPVIDRASGVPFCSSDVQYYEGDTADDVSLSTSHSEEYIGKFNDIRVTIDGFVHGYWSNLPNPEVVEEAAAQFTRVTEFLSNHQLSEGAAGTPGKLMQDIGDVQYDLRGHGPRDDPSVPNYGSTPNDVGSADYRTPALVGHSADTVFAYVENLYKAVDSCRQVAEVLSTSMSAQATLWRKARESVADAVAMLANECDFAARREGGSSVGSDEVLFALSVGVTLVAIPAAGVTAGVLAGVSIGLAAVGYADAKRGDGPVFPSQGASSFSRVLISDYASADRALRQLFETSYLDRSSLSDAVFRDENVIVGNLEDTVSALYAARSIVDLTPQAIWSVTDTYQVGADSSERIDRACASLKAISGEIMRIADEVSGCASAVEPGRRSIVHRDDGIGLGAEGPTSELVNLTDILRGLLAELSWEADDIAGNLRAAADLLIGANNDAVARLTATAAEIDGGYPDGIDLNTLNPNPRRRRR